jgi:hypothetical protein
MSKRIIIISFFLVLLSGVYAQQRMNFIDTDKKSYELFEEQKWYELIKYSTEARKQGIDFFYLQARTGIAWYNMGKYRKAAHWFLKAWANDQSFDWLQEYLYYSLVFSGQKMEANNYASDFSNLMKSKINTKESGIFRLAYETGYSFNADFEDQKTHAFNEEVNLGDDYGEAYFLNNYSFHSFDLSHRVSSKLIINHNITYIGVNREAIVDWGGQTNSPIKINQFQYFINPVLLIGKKINVSPSMNIIFGNSDIYAGLLNSNSSKEFSLTKTTYNDVVFSTALWSNYGNFSPGMEINAGNINASKFLQMSSWITFYPLSNANLYFTPRVYFKTGTNNESFGWNAFSFSAGAQIGPIHLFGQYLFGNLENFIESAGYVVANFPGKSDRKIMGSIFLPLGKKNQLVFRYINQNIIENYQVYTEGYKSNTLEYNYLKHTLTGGISWNL